MTELLEQNKADQIVAEAASDVVETMFFTSVVEEDEVPEAAADGAELAMKVSFQGHPSGSFRLRLREESARAMAGVFLSADEEELSAEQIRGVLGELANMIAGAALSRLDPKAKFDLSSPAETSETEFSRETRSASCKLPLECGWLHVGLWID